MENNRYFNPIYGINPDELIQQLHDTKLTDVIKVKSFLNSISNVKVYHSYDIDYESQTKLVSIDFDFDDILFRLTYTFHNHNGETYIGKQNLETCIGGLSLESEKVILNISDGGSIHILLRLNVDISIHELILKINNIFNKLLIHDTKEDTLLIINNSQFDHNNESEDKILIDKN